MTMIPVTSSMLSHIGYDAERLTLLVRFNPSKKQAAAGEPGDLWEYSPVVSERWDEAQAVLADPEGSIGKWFLSAIKGKYDGRKPEVDAAAAPAPLTDEELFGGATAPKIKHVEQLFDTPYSDFDSDDNWGEGPIDGNS